VDGDGVQDYFWLDHEGKGWGYLNQGKGKDSWYGLGEIAKGVGHAREDIRMGVLTKSGRADYLVVTDEDSGEVQWWQNLGPDYDYNWASRGVAATGPGHTIRNEYGWKFNKKNVRFAEYATLHSYHAFFRKPRCINTSIAWMEMDWMTTSTSTKEGPSSTGRTMATGVLTVRQPGVAPKRSLMDLGL
jgi:hypothetical protein